jgi:DNA invertase Pin-like site-specific DNA recombinase
MSRSNGTAGEPVAVYYRMSDLRQESSIERQRSQVEPYAREHGYRIVKEYTDEGISGDEIARRKGFQRLLRDAQAGLFVGILCDDKDRFGRFDSIDSGEVVAPLRRKGVWLETVAQGRVDWHSFAGRITDAVLQEAKRLEQEAISRRILSNQLVKAGQGIDTGSRPLYGYRRGPGPDGRVTLVPDGHKAEVVRLIFELCDRGETLYGIAEELYHRGVPSPGGRTHWSRSVIGRLLTNRRYTGDWTWGVSPQGKRHRYGKAGLRPTRLGEHTPYRSDPETWLVIPDHHEGLVSRDQFERVRARLHANQKQTTPHPRGGSFVLSRLLVCGHCGSFLVGVTDRGQRLYVCGGYLHNGPSRCHRNRVHEKPLTDLLLRQLQHAFLDPEHLQALRAEVAARQAERQSDGNRGRLKARADDLACKIDRGNENLALLPADRVPGVVEKVRQWERERQAALDELGRLDSLCEVEDLEKQIATAEAALWRLQEAVQAQDAPLLRRLFQEMVDRAVLRWTHHDTGKLTRCRLQGGEIYLRTSQEPYELSPSAGRPHCWSSRAPRARTGHPSP